MDLCTIRQISNQSFVIYSNPRKYQHKSFGENSTLLRQTPLQGDRLSRTQTTNCGRFPCTVKFSLEIFMPIFPCIAIIFEREKNSRRLLSINIGSKCFTATFYSGKFENPRVFW